MCIPCLVDRSHGPFHDDGTVNDLGTLRWVEEGNQFPWFNKGDSIGKR